MAYIIVEIARSYKCEYHIDVEMNGIYIVCQKNLYTLVTRLDFPDKLWGTCHGFSLPDDKCA